MPRRDQDVINLEILKARGHADEIRRIEDEVRLFKNSLGHK
jgi:hypothetical protein